MQREDTNTQWRRRSTDIQGSSSHRDRDERNVSFHRHSRGWSYHNRQRHNSFDRSPRRHIPYNQLKNNRFHNPDSGGNYQNRHSYWNPNHNRYNNRDYRKSDYSSFEESPSRHLEERDRRSEDHEDRDRRIEERDRKSPDWRRRTYSSEDDERSLRRSENRTLESFGERRRYSERSVEDSPFSGIEKESAGSSIEGTPKSSHNLSQGENSSNNRSEYEDVVELANKISSFGSSLRDPRLIARVLKIKKQDPETPVIKTEPLLSPVPDTPKNPNSIPFLEEISSDIEDDAVTDQLKESKFHEIKTTVDCQKEIPLLDPRLTSPKKFTRNSEDLDIKPVTFKPDPEVSKGFDLKPLVDEGSIDTPNSPVKSHELPGVEKIVEDPLKAKEVEESIINECKILVGDLDQKLKMPAVKSIQGSKYHGAPPKPPPTPSLDVANTSKEKETPKQEQPKSKESDVARKVSPQAPSTSKAIEKPSPTTTVPLLKDSFMSKMMQEGGRAKMSAPSKPETKQNQAILQMAFSPDKSSSGKQDSGAKQRSSPKQPGIKGILNKVMKTSISQVLRTNLGVKKDGLKIVQSITEKDSDKTSGSHLDKSDEKRSPTVKEVAKSSSILKSNILPKLQEHKKSTSGDSNAENAAKENSNKVSSEELVKSSQESVSASVPVLVGQETEDKAESSSSSKSPPVLERSDNKGTKEMSMVSDESSSTSPIKTNKARKSHSASAVLQKDDQSTSITIDSSTDEKSKHQRPDSRNRNTKRTKRKPFRGGTYGLYLSTPKKKKKRPSKSPDGTIIKYEDLGGTETTGSVLDSADEGSYRSDLQTSSEKSYQEDEPQSKNSSNEATDKIVADTESFPMPTSRIKKEIIEPEESEGHMTRRRSLSKIKQEVMEVSSGTEQDVELDKNNYSKDDMELMPTGEAAVPEYMPSHSDTDTSVTSRTANANDNLRNTVSTRLSVRANKSSGQPMNKDGSSIALSVKSRQRIKRRTVDENDVNGSSDVTPSETPKRQRRDQTHKVHATLSNSNVNGIIPKIEVLYDNSLAPVVVCTCQTNPLDATNESSNSKIYCQAIDSIDEKLIGCCNEVSTHHLVRPSVKIPFTAMCEVHLWRLKHHQCCPVCGIFCSQGDFVQCRGGNTGSNRIHLFHNDCKIVFKIGDDPLCPHCGQTAHIKPVTLELNTPTASTFYLSQKPMFSEPRAKMTFTRLNEIKEDLEEFPARSIQVPETGKVFSSAGLPVGADRTQLEAMLVALDTEKLAFLNYSEEQLYVAAQNGIVENVLYMLALGFDPNKTYPEFSGDCALHGAAANGHLVTVHLLLQAGASIDQTNTRLYTPLMEAIEKKQVLIVQYLIKCGAQLLLKGEDGMSALHLAARCGSLAICKLLLNTGKITANIQDEGGWTPIVWAAEHSHVDIVKLLIERGADTTIRDNEENIALHWSAYSGNVDISQLLLDLGSKLNVVNEHGDTPLHIAARQNNYECVVLFLARGGDVEAVNKEKETPINCCLDQNSPTYLALMMNSELKRLTKNRPIKAERIIHKDISRGKEPNCIQCLNGVDEEPAPSDFLYITKNCETSAINIDRTITSLQSCQCEDDCTSSKCTCATISFKCWYDNEGKLLPEFNMPDPPMIFECNQACLCWKNCNNRVLQHGILSRLQLFRTTGKGWGVRTLKDIPRGTFICEYVGEIISDSEADQREDDSYLFDLDNRDGETYCLDARYYGNISRFINHLCEPNLVPVKVFVEHQDLSFPRIAFFSSREIKAGEELGFDYGEKFWVIKYKCFTCGCDSPNCKYSKDTIHQTLESYYRRLKEEHPEEEVENCVSVI